MSWNLRRNRGECQAVLGMARGAMGGFSLVEVLAVTTILLVVGVLGTASFSRMQESAGNAACLSNLRQLAFAGLAYSAEHNGLLPAKNWHSDPGTEDSILGYIPQASRKLKKGVLQCPNLNRTRKSGSGYGRTYGQNVYSIGSPWEKQSGDIQEPYQPSRLSQVLYPSRMILFGDAVNPSWHAPFQAYAYDETIGIQGIGGNDYRDLEMMPHGAGPQFAFVDGSVRLVPSSELVAAGVWSDLWRGGYAE